MNDSHTMPRSSSSQEPRKRRAHSASRTGCLTCRRRRVKCGEEKPTCLRCFNLVNWDGECEYSAVRKDRAGHQRPVPIHPRDRKLLPKNFKNTKATKSVLSKPSSISASIQPSNHGGTASTLVSSRTSRSSSRNSSQDLISFPVHSNFKTQQQHRFHNFFCTDVAFELSSFSPSDLWQRLILQAAEADPYIRDGVIAVGALYKIIRAAPHMRPPDAHAIFKDEHAFAVQEYQRALAGMRDAISSGAMDVRSALLACLLTVCFENAYGRKDLALLNCESGAKMRRKLAIPMLSNGSSRRELAGGGSSMIEDELLAVFSRLDISAMIYLDHYAAEHHRMAKDELDVVIRGMPRIFDTMEEAIAYGNAVMNRCWHFINIVQGLDRPPIFLRSNHDYAKHRWGWADLRYGSNAWFDTDKRVPEKWLKEAADCSMELDKWFVAFEPLWLKFKNLSDAPPKGFYQATLLRLQAITTKTSVRGSVYTRETDWDAHLPEFDEVVSLAETYLTLKPKRFYFSFEGETVIYLCYVLLKCRDGAIRRRALRGLDEHPRREASWDATRCASIGRWAMVLEEGQREHVQCNDIKEEDRVRIMGMQYDTLEGDVHIWCYQLRDGERVCFTLLQSVE